MQSDELPIMKKADQPARNKAGHPCVATLHEKRQGTQREKAKPSTS